MDMQATPMIGIGVLLVGFLLIFFVVAVLLVVLVLILRKNKGGAQQQHPCKPVPAFPGKEMLDTLDKLSSGRVSPADASHTILTQLGSTSGIDDVVKMVGDEKISPEEGLKLISALAEGKRKVQEQLSAPSAGADPLPLRARAAAENRLPVTEIICAAVIIIASFMPWGSIKATINHGFGSSQTIHHMNGWNWQLMILGVTIPNWTLVIAAIAIVTTVVLKCAWRINVPPVFNIFLSGYGVFHCGMVVLFFATKGRLGAGSLLSLASFIVLIVLSIKALSDNTRAATIQNFSA